MSLTLPPVKPIRRVYPHVDEITDPSAQQSVKLAWDRIHSLEERLQAAEAANATLVAAHNTNLTAIATAQATATGALDALLKAPPAPDGITGQTLPAEAPNMLATLNTVFGSQPWKFDGGDVYDQTQPDGRGAFVEAAVLACHALDPRWGHIRKNPGQNQYNGHAVDFMLWKNPDGVTAEGYDILSTAVQWNFAGRDANLLAKWYF
jgi:hypothetical protein